VGAGVGSGVGDGVGRAVVTGVGAGVASHSCRWNQFGCKFKEAMKVWLTGTVVISMVLCVAVALL
jgi:hypothetical protein